jgi:hypothetical protein
MITGNERNSMTTIIGQIISKSKILFKEISRMNTIIIFSKMSLFNSNFFIVDIRLMLKNVLVVD